MNSLRMLIAVAYLLIVPDFIEAQKIPSPCGRVEVDRSSDPRAEKALNTLLRLVSTHPDTTIRTQFFVLYCQNQFALTLNLHPAFSGSNPTIFAGFILDKQGADLIPLFIFGTQLYDPKISDGWKQAYIFHESRHYTQYKSKAVPAEAFTTDYYQPLTVEKAVVRYGLELDAYSAQVEFELQSGLTASAPTAATRVYLEGGERALRVFVAEHLGDSLIMSDMIKDAVMRIAGDMSWHPPFRDARLVK